MRGLRFTLNPNPKTPSAGENGRRAHPGTSLAAERVPPATNSQPAVRRGGYTICICMRTTSLLCASARACGSTLALPCTPSRHRFSPSCRCRRCPCTRSRACRPAQRPELSRRNSVVRPSRVTSRSLSERKPPAFRTSDLRMTALISASMCRRKAVVRRGISAFGSSTHIH